MSRLLLLPLEIRTIIYEALLAPTGTISFVRTSYHQTPVRYRIYSQDPNGNEEICLSFFRVCTQIRDEVKKLDIFWKQNTLDVETLAHQGPESKLWSAPKEVGRKLKSVELDLGIQRGGPETRDAGRLQLHQLVSFLNTTRLLAFWADTYSLTRMTLNVRRVMMPAGIDTQRLEPAGLRYLTQLHSRDDGNDSLWKSYLTELRRAAKCYAGPAYDKLERRMVIDIGPPRLDRSGFPSQWYSDGDPEAMIQDLHRAWGGSLYFCGRLAYNKHGQQVEQLFQLFTDAVGPEDRRGRGYVRSSQPKRLFYACQDIELAKKMWAQDLFHINMSEEEQTESFNTALRIEYLEVLARIERERGVSEDRYDSMALSDNYFILSASDDNDDENVGHISSDGDESDGDNASWQQDWDSDENRGPRLTEPDPDLAMGDGV